MSTLSATASIVTGTVTLDADFSDVTADVMVISRSRADTGATGVVRASGPSAAISAAYLQMNLNGDFETNVTNWSALGSATLAQSSTQKHRGSSAMSITTVASAGPGAESEKEAATPGQVYAYSVWIYNPTAGLGMSAGIKWYNSSSTLISSTLPPSGAQNALSVGWNLIQGSATAPPGTATASLVVQNLLGSSLGAGIVFYLDEARLLTSTTLPSVTGTLLVGGQATSYDAEMTLDVPWSYMATGYLINGTWGIQIAATPAVTAVAFSGGRGWLRDPLVPANSLSLLCGRLTAGWTGYGGLAFLGLGDQTYKSNTTAFAVNNTPYPVAISRVRSSDQSTLMLAAHTFADRDALRTLLANGTPLLLQLPARYGEPDRYCSFGDEAIGKLGQDQRVPKRVFSLPFMSVQAPAGPAQGPIGARFGDMCQRYTTWGAFSAGATGTYDGFARTVAAGSWGTPDVGGTYTLDGTAAQFSVTPGVGQIAINALNTYFRARTGSMANGDLFVTVVIGAVALTQPIRLGLTARYVDASNWYAFVIEFGTGGTATPRVIKNVAGTVSTVASGSTFTYTGSSIWRMHARLNGTALSLATWAIASAEPATPQVSTTDASFAAAGPFGPQAFATTGNTNTLPYTVSFDDLLYMAGATWRQVGDGVTV